MRPDQHKQRASRRYQAAQHARGRGRGQTEEVETAVRGRGAQRRQEGDLPSNAYRYDEEGDSEDNETQSDVSAAKKLRETLTTDDAEATPATYFKFRDEQDWSTDIDNLSANTDLLAIDLQLLAKALNDIPFYIRLGLLPSQLTEDLVDKQSELYHEMIDLSLPKLVRQTHEDVVKALLDTQANTMETSTIRHPVTRNVDHSTATAHQTIPNKSEQAIADIDELLDTSSTKVPITHRPIEQPAPKQSPPPTLNATGEDWLDDLLG